MRGKATPRAGFTLIELMIVIGIMGLVAAMGLPSFVRNFRKEGMRKAVSDVVEACGNARAAAILTGDVTELVFHPRDGSFSVVKAPPDVGGWADSVNPAMLGGGGGIPGASVAPMSQTASAGPPAFSARFPDNVLIELLGVNFMEYQEADLARVRFYPNGMSDEFTIILRSDRDEWRKITLESVTALAEVTFIK
jgi:prepilin-type N-terminal cleavage/methylation domain-containing protein